MRIDRELGGLTLADLSDREFLLVIRDAGGVLPVYVTSTEIADHLNLTGENPTRSISARLAWMKRLGAVEREYERNSVTGNIKETRDGRPVHTQGWALSDLGFQMAVGKLNKAQKASLDKLSDGQMLVTVAWVAQRVQSDAQVGRLMDRAYRSGLGKR